MNMRWMMMACLSLCAATACDLPDKNIGDETQGDDTQGDSGTPGDDCEPGETVPAADGCNTCFCEEGGFLSCTEIGCDLPDTDGDPTDGDTSGECEPGTTVPAPDGCNTCFCNDDGTIGACTEIGCEPQECEPGTSVPAGDGCNTCFCEDDGTIGACTVAECDTDTDPFDGPEVSSCNPGTPFDDLAINGASIDGDTLTIDVAYSGCGPGHPLGACWDGFFAESSPVQVHLEVAHDDLDEVCDAFPSDSVDIDLTPLRQSFEEAYDAESGTITINIGGGESIDYTF